MVASIADGLIAKLKLDELRPEEKPAALIAYFNNILTGKIRTSPPELQTLLALMVDCQPDDTKKLIITYINTHQNSIDIFFSDHMQRFDRFDFKPYFLRIKGIEPGREFAVPTNARRNFEQIKPLDTRLYKDMLEGDQSSLKMKKASLQKVDAAKLADLRAQEKQKITALLNNLQRTIGDRIKGGGATREQVLAKLHFVEELFIPALQLSYNEPALQKLAELLLDGADPAAAEEVFASLRLPLRQQELFCAALAKKI
ncbi:hypothetical protein NO2_1401 [Candidatus Termititenax persephonae]|uniref:Uncharacterized protein n=1 Tax=Candidatus Termititenax persephonae TaxID=2218525 RepID=A0A388TJB2_9BACT|nr:hypothetical protein NO2_1401 [Candidatus Termititenax persephonae]